MMRYFKPAFLLVVTLLFASFAANAQESETKVVDEVVAQVNDGVITLSRVKAEMKGFVDAYVQEGKKREEAEKMVEEKRGELIANLINEELLMQKGKELGVESDVEAGLNSRFLQIMKQYNLKTLDQLYDEMRKQGLDPQEVREGWRRQAMREEVVRREVQSKLYWAATATDVKAYFDAHRDKFVKPEQVSLSEIFLSFAGRDPESVRQKAKQLVAQLRSGADFEKAVLENSDRPNAADTKGKVDTFALPDLDDRFRNAIKGVKAGGYSDPIEIDGVGINILRVDNRVAQESDAKYDENAVRMAILSEKAPDEQKKFMAKLRSDAYIKISDEYRPMVSPILFADERTAKTADTKAKN